MKTLSLLLAFACAAFAIPEPQSFTLNCKACHALDQQIVGPSLVEIAKIYRTDRETFLKWTINPGKKRQDLPEMPAMAHVPEKDLHEIYQYILKATAGVKEKKKKRTDPWANNPHKLRRPRVQRIFLPDTGPASLYVALAGPQQLNLVWDTTLCRLRYLTSGEPNDWWYLQGNGNALAGIGKSIYSEHQPLLESLKDQKPLFKGYRINPDGLPTFLYQLGEIEVTETILSPSSGTVERRFKLSESPNEVTLVFGKNAENSQLTTTSKFHQPDKTSFSVFHTFSQP
ncbi:MAG: c-type cytochrome [Verrucomicrobiota bacterium]